MTHRERREARAENLRGWADKRKTDAAAVFAAGEPYRGDIAFATQPGHIPLRARVIAREDRAHESLAKARSMTSRADGIEDQLARAIYDDDPDAIEALERRILELEAERAHMTTKNAEFRKAHRAELKTMTAYQRSQAVPFPSYSLSNLSGNLKRNRDRLARLKVQAERSAASEKAGGTLVEDLTHGYCRVTFADKPARETLDALKAAGFSWGHGSWTGQRDQLPAEVTS